MCELFGLSSNQPASPGELLCRFGARGGASADNPDGWGLATHEDGAFRLEKEPFAAARSTRFRQLCGQVHSSLILGHVRKANPPTTRIAANTHPFRRVCCGREWVFAHNGVIHDMTALAGPGAEPPCAPSGDTDSERAFCAVLDRIAAAMSSLAATEGHGWLDALTRTAEQFASRGRFNFLMSDGVHLIAYGHDRLHSLVGANAGLRLDVAGDAVIIATEPLTEDPEWLAFEPGELRVYRAGRQIAHIITHPRTGPVMPNSGLPASLKIGASP